MDATERSPSSTALIVRNFHFEILIQTRTDTSQFASAKSMPGFESKPFFTPQ